MTQEEKQLLLKDLCARLPYGVKCHYNCVVPICGRLLKKANAVNVLNGIEPTLDGHIGFKVGGDKVNAFEDDIKPYLRPMSSMTEEEMKELSNYENSVQRTDFFYSHYIDCRFMIEKGLALEAPEGMYKTE